MKIETVLDEGDSWETYHDLMDAWAAAGGTSNPRFKHLRIWAQQMKKRLEAAGISESNP